MRDLLHPLDGECKGEFRCGKFNPGDFAVRTDAKLAEAESMERFLCVLYLLQDLTGNGLTIFDT